MRRLLLWLLLGVALPASAGLFYLGCLARASMASYQAYQFEFTRHYTDFGHSGGSSASYSAWPTTSDIAIQATLSAVLVVLPLLVVSRRFSLRALSLGVLGVGAAVALPVSIHRPRPARVLVAVCFDAPVPTEDVNFLRQALQPAAAKASLPKGFLEQLPVDLEELRVEVHAAPLKDLRPTREGLACIIDLPPGLRAEAASDIVACYQDYVSVLAIERMRARGLVLRDADNGESWRTNWRRWRPEWDALRLKSAAK